jgi:hypothetical protein
MILNTLSNLRSITKTGKSCSHIYQKNCYPTKDIILPKLYFYMDYT